jgi:hypothetical protein
MWDLVTSVVPVLIVLLLITVLEEI